MSSFCSELPSAQPFIALILSLRLSLTLWRMNTYSCHSSHLINPFIALIMSLLLSLHSEGWIYILVRAPIWQPLYCTEAQLIQWRMIAHFGHSSHLLNLLLHWFCHWGSAYTVKDEYTFWSEIPSGNPFIALILSLRLSLHREGWIYILVWAPIWQPIYCTDSVTEAQLTPWRMNTYSVQSSHLLNRLLHWLCRWGSTYTVKGEYIFLSELPSGNPFIALILSMRLSLHSEGWIHILVRAPIWQPLYCTEAQLIQWRMITQSGHSFHLLNPLMHWFCHWGSAYTVKGKYTFWS